MFKNTGLQALSLALSTMATSNVSAAIVTATFDGIFVSSAPGFQIFQLYSDQHGLLPFSIPADGTPFQAVVRYDDNAPLSNPPLPGGNPNAWALSMDSLSFSMGSNSYSSPVNNQLLIVNDTTINGIPDTYGDGWIARNYSQQPGSPNVTIEYGISYVSTFSTAPGGPLSSIDTSVPSAGSWDQAFLFYRVIDNSGITSSNPSGLQKHALVNAFITNVSVEVAPVPVPAAIWLFGSAILGTCAIRRGKSS